MTETKLWSFALAVYQRDAVAPACLDLQEQCQIDVPLMLCAVFACLQGKAISNEDLTQLHNLAGSWQSDIVQSLRRIRTRLKTGPKPAPNAVTEDLRNKVKAAELAAEKIQLEMMQTWVSQLTNIDMVEGLPALPKIINTITRIVETRCKTEITQIQHDHIRVIAAAACQIKDHKTEIIQP
ncbi:TIGR02444 family protein [Candidatus Puniceispirillum sp.]|nr:TIGR02444 family protein [Alphaproteobacteria bacterium]MDC1293934.1 TIGR02444 family protein [Candidatus Puniceispirillum sp.]